MHQCFLIHNLLLKKSLKKFLKFFLLKTRKINSCIINKKFQKTYKKKVLSILKSPHVHKTAQEQFEIEIYNRRKIYSLKNLKTIDRISFIFYTL